MAWEAMQAAIAASRRAPLSARHALFAAMMLDRLSEAAFAEGWATPVRGADILAFRAALARACPAMAAVMELAGAAQGGPWLEVAAQPVQPQDLAALPVADFMVSLYSRTVPRLVLRWPSGAAQDMQALLQAAADWWAAARQPG